MDLPTANDLFGIFFRPWYPSEHAFDYPGVGPDWEVIELNPGEHIRVIQRLDQTGQTAMREQIAGMTDAANQDLPSILSCAAPLEDGWLDAFESRFTPEKIQALLQQSDPAQPNNNFLILCCELGCAFGQTLVQRRPGLQWIYDGPYWDSFLFDLNRMTRINVFHWAIKRLSINWENETPGKKIDSVIDFLTANPE